jgi:hypothetical protein
MIVCDMCQKNDRKTLRLKIAITCRQVGCDESQVELFEGSDVSRWADVCRPCLDELRGFLTQEK